MAFPFYTMLVVVFKSHLPAYRALRMDGGSSRCDNHPNPYSQSDPLASIVRKMDSGGFSIEYTQYDNHLLRVTLSNDVQCNTNYVNDAPLEEHS